MNVEGRVFFKVLSSSSFFKGKRLLVLKYNMADKTSVHSPHENVFKQTLSPRSFYVFRKDRQCKFIFLLSPSLDPINIISVRALEAVKVAERKAKPCREAGVLRRLLALIYNPGKAAGFA